MFDPVRVRQVLLNLLSNGIKFTSAGDVLLRVSLLSQTPDEAELHFSVGDDGIGIPAEKQASIFEAFTQADNSIGRNFGGTGLGLTISSRLVALMNSRIELESEPNRGSVFHFRLACPILKDSEASFAESLDRLSHSLAVRSRRLLIADDNPRNAAIVQRLTQSWGFRADVAASGESAIHLALAAGNEDTPYDFFLLDAEMPRVNGFACAKALKGYGYDPARLMIMLASTGLREASTKIAELNISTYFVKPVAERELFAALQRFLTGQPNSANPAKEAAEPALEQVGLRVLVAEDNATNQRLVSRLLEKQGHLVTVASDGLEALAALKLNSFDVVLMDVQMPNLDGFQTTAAIRQAEAATGGRLPIIALTAHAISGYKETCLQAGMDGYLSKPIHSAELSRILKQLGQTAMISPVSLRENTS
jgi:two-component system sensor histidine kinase/response regulator